MHKGQGLEPHARAAATLRHMQRSFQGGYSGTEASCQVPCELLLRLFTLATASQEGVAVAALPALLRCPT